LRLRRHGRRAAEKPALALIRPQNAQPIEDRKRVEQRAHDRTRAELRAAETILEPDRQLADATVSEGGGDGDQLEVEGEALDEQQREDVFDHRAVEDLEPDLRVADVEAEEQTVQSLVAPASDPT
jgi:hypothetical protein